MMDDNEIKRTLYYLQGRVRQKFFRFSHVDDLVDEVSIALMNVLPNVDFDNPRYRAYICRGVFSHIHNYWVKYFWDRERKIAKPNASIEHVTRHGKSILDKIPNEHCDNDQLLRIDLQTELARLSERERDIFLMTYVDNASEQDIAYKYGISKQRVSQICISTRILLSKRLSVYRGNSSAYGKCKKCGGACRSELSMCNACRAVNRRETLRKTALKKRGANVRVFKKGVAA